MLTSSSRLFSRFTVLLVLSLLGLAPAYAGLITFEDLPDANFFNGDDQNIGNFYPGLTFGPDVTGLSVSRFGGYANDAFPPNSGDVVIFDASDPTITIDFSSPINSFGIWYTSFDPLTLQLFDQSNNLLGTVLGNPNTDGTTGTNSFLSFSNPAISSVELTSTPGFFTLDDLTFQSGGSSAAPEPGTFVLLASVLLVFALYHSFRRPERSLVRALVGRAVLARLRGWGWRVGLTAKVLVVVCLGLVPLFGQTDTTPPVLTGMSFSSPSVNVTSASQSITVSLTLTDNLSGVNFTSVLFGYNEFTLQSPSGKQVISITNIGTGFTLKSGTGLDGVWQATLTIPQFSEAGLWTVTAVHSFDNSENGLSLTTSQLAASGFPTSLSVTSNPDLTPPALLGLNFAPSSINTTSSSQPVTLTLNLADAPAGVVFPGGNQIAFDCEVVSPSGKQVQWLASDNFKLISGTPQSGSWAGVFTLPQYTEPGTWTIQQLLLRDAANNSENLNAAAITALGFSPTFTVSDSTPDTTPPVLTAFNLSPQVLDTSVGPQTVVATLQITDNLSGASFAFTTADFTFFYGPSLASPGNTVTLRTFCTQTPTAGNPQNGTYKCNITMPAFSAAGPWTVSTVSLKDADVNSVSYTTAQLQAFGFPTVVTVEPLTSGAVFLGGTGGTTNPTVLVAEPVNSATGNYFSTHADLAVQGRGLSFSFTRYYNSLDPYSGPLGPGWNHIYNILLAINSANSEVTVRQPDGSTILFTPSGGGSYTAATIGLFDALVQNGDGSFTLTRKNQVKLIFSTNGQLTSIADRNGNTQTLTYSGGNLVAVTDTVGRSFLFSYDSNNHLLSLVDPSGRTVLYAYNASGNLISCQDAAGGITQYSYDAGNRLLSGTDPRGVVYVQNTYDSSGRVASQTGGRGFTTTFAYNTPSGNTTTVTDPLGNATQYVYDSSLQIVQIINAQSGSISYTYDANNDKTAITNANGKTTQFTYDGKGNVTSITNPLGNTASFTYDSKNDMLTATNASGAVTAFSYDGNGNLSTTRDALSNKTTLTYDVFGELVSRTDALGNTSILTYDARGNATKIANALGNVTTLGYDGISRATSVTDGNGHTFTVTYDALSRRTKTTDALGHQTQYSYDLVGNLLKVIDANGNPTAYEYDNVDNLVTVTDALGNKTTYGYDGNNNRTLFTSASGNSTAYKYDSLNRRIKVTDPLGLFSSYLYDAAGNAVSVTDANGKTHTVAYDALNRPTIRTYSDGNVISYSYDVNGNRVSMTDSHGVTSYTFDILSRLISVNSVGGSSVKYAYDAVGHRVGLTYPDGRIVTYAYDAASRLSQVTDWLNRNTAYTYDLSGNRIATVMGNGAKSGFSYDNSNRLVGIVNLSGSKVLTSFAYSLDAAGNRTQVVDVSGGLSHYGYDALNRLTVWTAPSGQLTSYSYDVGANRTSTTSSAGTTAYTYDADDRLLTGGSSSYTYDGDGNRLTKTTGGTTISYGFDALNRLMTVSGGGVSAQYQYDGDGNRLSQQAGASSYQYALDVARRNPAVLSETGSDGNIDFQYGLTMLSGSSATLEQFYQADGIGSTADVTDATDTLKASYTYDPWGKLLNPIDPLGTKDKFKFAGEALDPQTGLYYLRARYYDPAVGRFISKDPLSGTPSAPATRNRYAYALANPERYTDSLGLAADSIGGDQAVLHSGALTSAFGLLSALGGGFGSFNPPVISGSGSSVNVPVTSAPKGGMSASDTYTYVGGAAFYADAWGIIDLPAVLVVDTVWWMDPIVPETLDPCGSPGETCGSQIESFPIPSTDPTFNYGDPTVLHPPAPISGGADTGGYDFGDDFGDFGDA